VQDDAVSETGDRDEDHPYEPEPQAAHHDRLLSLAGVKARGAIAIIKRESAMSQSEGSSAVASHRAAASGSIACAVATISDTRTRDTDRSGDQLARYLEEAGHAIVERTILRDEPDEIRSWIQGQLASGRAQAILLTGGTGISPRDQTYETIEAMLTRRLPGYGELFRMLSYAEIGAAAILSRATAGLVGAVAVFTMPGSTAAVRLAMERIIVPELGHVVREATKPTGSA
jgi:molybdenum cofactor biosynthesis protein B